MQALLVFLAVAALSLLASSRTLLDPGRFPAVAQLSASGLLFLVFGALLGPGLGGVLREGDLLALRPVLSVGLGTAGVILGLNLDPRLLRLLPLRVVGAAMAHAGVTLLAVTAPLALALALTSGLPAAPVAGAATILGGAACVSSGHLAVLGYRSGRIERRRGLAVSLLTMLDDVVGLAVLVVALAASAAATVTDGIQTVALALLVGLACGALVAFMVHGLKDRGELSAVTLGAVALVSGAAAYLGVSALLAGVACGITLALVGGLGVERLARMLGRFERPVFLVTVFLIGCHLQARDLSAWLLLPAFVGLRFVGKVGGGHVAQRLAQDALPLPPRVGYALVAQGGLALCLVAEYLVLVPGPLAQRLFDVAVLATLANELLAARAFPEALAHPERAA